MLLATALASTYTGCAQQTFTVQNKPAAVAPKETITHHFFVSGIGQKKTVDAAKICGGAENVVKTETQQTFVNGLLSFCAWHLYSAGSVCIAHNNCMSCPSIWPTLSTLSCILLGSFQLFLRSDQPLSEGWNNPVQRCLPVGGGCINVRRRRGGFTLTDRLLWCATDDDQRQHLHAEHHFQL